MLDELPSEVRQVADNYNHLMEQPTIFYALVFAIVLEGNAGAFDVALTWGYVALRIVHSCWQALVNRVMVRFYLFVASTALVVPLALRAFYGSLALRVSRLTGLSLALPVSLSPYRSLFGSRAAATSASRAASSGNHSGAVMYCPAV